MTEWQDIRIGDLGRVVTGKTPPTSKPEYYGGTTQFLTPTDMDGRRIINQTLRYLSEEGENKVSSSLLPKGSVSVSCIGSDMGKTVLVGKKSVTNQQINSVIVEDKFDNLFVYYNLSGRKSELQFLSTGAAQPIMNKTDFSNLTIKVPPLNIQRTIASVLGALDDKIENNRRMNETLEEMARAIFKSWFVDFDPVHAKAAGNEPAHMDAETAAIFPNSFGDDDLPVGFNLKTLKDEDVELESGKRPKGGIDKSLNEGIPSIGAESLQKIGEFEYSKVKFVEKEFAENSSKGWVQNYDVAIYKDGANVGDPKRVGLFGNGFPFDKFMVNEHVFLLRSKKLGQPFLYSLCQSENISHQLKSMGTSKAAQPGLNQQEVLSCEYVAPPQVLIAAFNKSVLSLINHRLSLGLQNQTLTELRDTLLPKLMSGELSVKDAEREVEAAV